MNCKEVQKRLSAHLDGELTPQLDRIVIAHLANCAGCSQIQAKLQIAYAWMAEEEPLAADPFMVTRVRAALTDSAAVGKRWRPSFFRLLLPASVAAGLALGMVLGQHLTAAWPAASTAAAESLEANLFNQLPATTLTISYLELSWTEGGENE